MSVAPPAAPHHHYGADHFQVPWGQETPSTEQVVEFFLRVPTCGAVSWREVVCWEVGMVCLCHLAAVGSSPCSQE